jgi:hypothetical protein
MHTNKIISKISSFLFIITTLLVLSSCKGGNKTAEQDQMAADSLNKALLATDIKEVIYPLPTPFEMTKMLNDIGATYSTKNLNSVTKVDKYFTEQNKRSLGIYERIWPTPTYQQQQDVQIYMNAIKTLADQLGIT